MKKPDALHFLLIILLLQSLTGWAQRQKCTATASFNASNPTAEMGETIQFVNTSERATRYEWQVNGFTVSEKKEFTYYFNGAGHFEVTLIAYGEGDCKSSYMLPFDVQRPPRHFSRETGDFEDDYNPDLEESGITVSDRFGNELSLDDLKIPNNTWQAGIFVLHFDDEDNFTGTGFDDPAAGNYFATAGQDRREVIIQVFEDITALITNGGSLPNPYTGITPNTKVEVRIMTNADPSGPMPPGAVASASQFYVDYPQAGITSGAVWQTITSGIDAYNGISSAPLFHGYMCVRLDNTVNWSLDLSGNSTIAGNQFDLYTTALHEAMHMLGFASLIGSSGSSNLGNNNYSLYDTYLRNGGTPLLTTSTNCYDHLFNMNPAVLTGGCSSVVFAGSGTSNANHVVHSPTSWAQGSSLSHFNCANSGCPLAGNGYVMNFCGGSGGPNSKQRIPHVSEVETLCDLGYNIQANYGNGDYSASTTTGNPFAGVCSNNTVAGVHDERSFNVNNNGALFTTTSNPGDVINLSSIDILGNDFGNPNQIQCLEIVYPAGSTAGSTVSSVTYDPPDYYTGSAILRYRPYNSGNGQYGNVTYIFVQVTGGTIPPCNPAQCNLVCHGDFDIFTPGTGNIPPPLSDFIVNTSGGNSPDVNVWNSNPYAQISAYGPEGITFALLRPINPGCVIDISFRSSAYRNNPSSNPGRLEIVGSVNPPCPASSGNTNVNCPTPTSCGYTYTPLCPQMVNITVPTFTGTFPFSGNPQFQQYNLVWTNTTGSPINHIVITGTNIPGFLLLEDLEIINRCEAELVVTPTVLPDSTPCVGDTVTVAYEVCLPAGVSFNNTTIGLQANLSSTPGLSYGPGGDFSGGIAVIPWGALTSSNPCTTLNLKLIVNSFATAGLPLPVDMGFGWSSGCVSPQNGLMSVNIIPGIDSILTIKKTHDPGIHFPGSPVTYTVEVCNTSLTTTITDILFEDQIPPGLVLSTISLPGNLSLNGNTVVSDPFDLGPAQCATFSFSISIDPAIPCGTLVNCTEVTTATGSCFLPQHCDTMLIHTMNPAPDAKEDSSYCLGTPMADLGANAPMGGQLVWYYGTISPGTFLGIGSPFTPPYTSVGIHQYIVVEYVGGCPGLPDTVTIGIFPQPVVNITPSSAGPFCVLDPPFNFSVTPPGGTWLSAVPGALDQNGTFYPGIAGPGQHQVGYFYFDSTSGCMSRDVVFVQVYDSIPIIDSVPDLCVGTAPYQLTASPPGGVWGGSAVSATGLFTPPGSPGLYQVTYAATYGQTCSDTGTYMVNVVPSNWQQVAGGPSATMEQGNGIQVDQDGNVYVTGASDSNAVFGMPNNPVVRHAKGFLAKYDECGDLVWVKGLVEPGMALILDVAEKNVFVTGGGQRAFLASYSASTGTQNWAELMPTTHPSVGGEGVAVAIDRDNNDMIYITGYFKKKIRFIGPPTFTLQVSSGLQDGFIAQYNANNNLWYAARQMIGSTPSTFVTPFDISVNDNGNRLYAGGSYTDMTNFSGYNLPGSGSFIVEFNTTGLGGINGINTSGYISGIDPIEGLDWKQSTGELFVTGSITVASFNPSLTGVNWSSQVAAQPEVFHDIFYDKISDRLYIIGDDASGSNAGTVVTRRVVLGGGFHWARNTSTASQFKDAGYAVATNGNQNIHITGAYFKDISFPGSTSHIASGTPGISDIFVGRLLDNTSSSIFYREKPGLDETDEEVFSFTIYPNPFKDQFNITFEGMSEDDVITVEVFDMLGKSVMKEQALNTAEKHEIEVDMRGIHSGLYMVKVNQGGKVHTARIVNK